MNRIQPQHHRWCCVYQSRPVHGRVLNKKIAPCIIQKSLIRSLPRVCKAYNDNSTSNYESLPQDDSDLVDWAATAFKTEVLDQHGKVRDLFSLEKACMLVALEEAAASAADTQQMDRPPSDPSSSSPSDHINNSTIEGAAATWSFDRVNALAAAATAEFYRLCNDNGVLDGIRTAVELNVSDNTLQSEYSDVIQSYPTTLITAINTILFDQHGYHRMQYYGDPRDITLNTVLERGRGNPGSLAILYMAVAERCGMPLHAIPLDQGRYFVLTPATDTIRLGIASERFVIDPYARGSLLSESEVKELFALDELTPASYAEIMAGVLVPLRDVHWSAAVGCPPEPAFMVPISLDVALGDFDDIHIELSFEDVDDDGTRGGGGGNGGGDVKSEHWYFSTTNSIGNNSEDGIDTIDDGRYENSSSSDSSDDDDDDDDLMNNVVVKINYSPPEKGSYNLERTISAARKIQYVLPNEYEPQMHLGVLLYFNGEYEESWQELSFALHMLEQQYNSSSKKDGSNSSGDNKDDDDGDWVEEEIDMLKVLIEKARLMIEYNSSFVA